MEREKVAGEEEEKGGEQETQDGRGNKSSVRSGERR